VKNLVSGTWRREPLPELSVYRDRTTALLRRYLRMSLAMGKMPTILGREIFRARVTSYRVHSFEDVVIFVHDMERCIARLDDLSREVIARVVLQEHNFDEAAEVMGCSRRKVSRALPLALDKTTEILLEVEMLSPFGFTSPRPRKPVSIGKNATKSACA
jgi:predicted DNA-binding protein (UPF0251 family)